MLAIVAGNDCISGSAVLIVSYLFTDWFCYLNWQEDWLFLRADHWYRLRKLIAYNTSIC